MKNILIKSAFAIASLFVVESSYAEIKLPILLHSHNDYENQVPFYQAYSQGINSIEVDLHYVDGKLMVGHDPEDISALRTFETLYVEPIVEQFSLNDGRAWRDSERELQLMIELKTATEPTLSTVVEVLNKHPEIFDVTKNKDAVRIVITGNIPAPQEFEKYPQYVMFDGTVGTEYTKEQLERVALISENFRQYTHWNGKGMMIASELAAVKSTIATAHEMGKPIRFWAAPDGVTTWYTFYNLGVDYLSPNNFNGCIEFMRDYHKKSYQIGSLATSSGDIARANRLDKVSRSFSGFNNDKLKLSQPIEIYTPEYKNDGSKGKIKNVILLIGDGMSFAQILAADCVNGGLSMLNMNHIGFQKTSAKDTYTTDSAAAGSALATGEKHNNRHISADANNTPIESITDVLHGDGYKCGVVTLGPVLDATPAAYFGHSTERDNSDEIADYLLDCKLDLLCGSDYNSLVKRGDDVDMIKELTKTYSIVRDVDDINEKDGKVICIDDRMSKAASEENLDLLANATIEAIEKLQVDNKKGFFLMVEGAKIDYAGHARSLPGSIVETLSFDLAIAEALRFADEDGETLVIVTGDHETGGLVILDGDPKSRSVLGYYVTDDHTPLMLPVMSYGPGAAKFIGTYENTEIPIRIKNLLNL